MGKLQDISNRYQFTRILFAALRTGYLGAVWKKISATNTSCSEPHERCSMSWYFFSLSETVLDDGGFFGWGRALCIFQSSDYACFGICINASNAACLDYDIAILTSHSSYKAELAWLINFQRAQVSLVHKHVLYIAQRSRKNRACRKYCQLK